jgi:hypothetical protein
MDPQIRFGAKLSKFDGKMGRKPVGDLPDVHFLVARCHSNRNSMLYKAI